MKVLFEQTVLTVKTNFFIFKPNLLLKHIYVPKTTGHYYLTLHIYISIGINFYIKRFDFFK